MSPEVQAARDERLRSRAERVAKRSHVRNKNELVIGGLYRDNADSLLAIVEKEGERFLYLHVNSRIRGLHYVADDGDYGDRSRENHHHWCNLSRVA